MPTMRWARPRRRHVPHLCALHGRRRGDGCRRRGQPCRRDPGCRRSDRGSGSPTLDPPGSDEWTRCAIARRTSVGGAARRRSARAWSRNARTELCPLWTEESQADHFKPRRSVCQLPTANAGHRVCLVRSGEGGVWARPLRRRPVRRVCSSTQAHMLGVRSGAQDRPAGPRRARRPV
jgi:hypothetical protein